tara:strand:+ start:578 stop:1222 length:645 start_codon:yes stop_codon:yes gene_type:complete
MINLYNRDCLEAMRGMGDNDFDLAIVDPPYGIGASKEKYTPENSAWKNKKKKGYVKKSWDNNTPSQEYFDELFRVSKNQIIWGCNYFTDKLPVHSGRIFWDKKETMPSFSKGELAYTSLFSKIEKWSFLWSGYKKEIQEHRTHPTQKPIALYTWLLDRYAKEGDKILDTHLGSGSIAIACHNLGYSLDGYELDPDYYQAACNRLKEHQKQLRLF